MALNSPDSSNLEQLALKGLSSVTEMLRVNRSIPVSVISATTIVLIYSCVYSCFSSFLLTCIAFIVTLWLSTENEVYLSIIYDWLMFCHRTSRHIVSASATSLRANSNFLVTSDSSTGRFLRSRSTSVPTAKPFFISCTAMYNCNDHHQQALAATGLCTIRKLSSLYTRGEILYNRFTP